MEYGENARKLVLGLKHGDRADIARAAGPWLARAAAPLLTRDTVVVPIPLHWVRLFQRKVNQSALLARAFCVETTAALAPDALKRTRRTPTQNGKSVEARFENQREAIRAHPRRGTILSGRDVLLVDDVMSSGATFAAATEACFEAGARAVNVLSLARTMKG